MHQLYLDASPSFSFRMNLHYSEPTVPWTLKKPPPSQYSGQDRTGLKIGAQRRNPIFRRFLCKMATFRYFPSNMHWLDYRKTLFFWPILYEIPPIWSSFKQCLISIVEFKNSLPSTRSDLSVRCWLIVWWNWFIHVFTLRPRQSSSLYQQLPSHIHCLHCSYYINSYYCAISAFNLVYIIFCTLLISFSFHFHTVLTISNPNVLYQFSLWSISSPTVLYQQMLHNVRSPISYSLSTALYISAYQLLALHISM